MVCSSVVTHVSILVPLPFACEERVVRRVASLYIYVCVLENRM